MEILYPVFCYSDIYFYVRGYRYDLSVFSQPQGSIKINMPKDKVI